jgi:hypothetical protein
MASAWNAAWALVRGDIVCPLDSDDAFAPEKLQTVVDAFGRRDPQAGLLVHAMTVIDQRDRQVQRLPYLTRFENGWLADAVVRRGGRWRYMPSSAIAFRREMGRFLFPIPEAPFRRNAEAMAVTLLPLLTRVIASDDALSFYRVHGANCIGGGARDRVTAQTVLDWNVGTTDAVNARLMVLGDPRRLDVSRNLEYRQALYIRSLFDGTTRARLIRQYTSLVSFLWRDDMYGLVQKVMGTAVYGTALLLPGRPRRWWISEAFGFSKAKSRLLETVGNVKALLSLRSTRLSG